jgi:2-iminobutanoate/2-iminopropanoate deaminase
MEIKRINTPNAPKPAGHYSQATVYNGLVFVAGQLSIDPATGAHKTGAIEEQTELALSNVLAILEAAGSDWSRVLKMTVYVADINLWDAVNKVYSACWASIDRPAPLFRPARSTMAFSSRSTPWPPQTSISQRRRRLLLAAQGCFNPGLPCPD